MKKDNFDIPVPPTLADLEAQEIWKEQAGRKIKSKGRLIFLEQALLTLQRIKEMEESLRVDGLTISGGKVSHSNPLLRHLEKHLQILSKQWIALGLTREEVRLERFDI